MKITYNQLLIFAIIMGIGWAFTCGLTLNSANYIKSKDSEQAEKIAELSKENENLKIEVAGLTRLIKLKDNQNICHYSHVEVKHDFRIVNKRK